jgi:MFS family permease
MREGHHLQTVLLLREFSNRLPEIRTMSVTDIVVNNAVLLVSEASRGIILGTQFAYIRSLGSEENVSSYTTAAVAIFSVGRLLANTALGYASDKWCYRSILVTALLIHAAGQLLYATSVYYNVYILLLSRFIVGFGSGVLATSRAYVGATTPAADKTRQFSFLGASKFVGYALTPAIALAMQSDVSTGGWVLNSYTAPGYFMCAATLITAIACQLKMSDVRAPLSTHPTANTDAPVVALPWYRRMSQWAHGLLTADRAFMLGSCMFIVLNFASKGVLTLMEATLAPLFQRVFVDSDNDMQEDTQQFLLYLGLGGLVVYVLMALKPTKPTPATVAQLPQPGLRSRAQRWLNHCAKYAKQWDLVLLIASQFITALGSLMLAIHPASLTLSRLVWSSMLIWSIASPVADTLAVSLFSAVVSDAGGKQGKMMAWISCAGSVGRIIFPLLTNVAPSDAVFGASAAVSAVCGVCLCKYALGTLRAKTHIRDHTNADGVKHPTLDVEDDDLLFSRSSIAMQDLTVKSPLMQHAVAVDARPLSSPHQLK